MNRKIFEKLKKLKPLLKKEFGITKIALFGSQARDDYDESSDVDIVIFEMSPKSYKNFIQAKRFLEQELQKKVDIGFYKSMNTLIKKLSKKIYIMFRKIEYFLFDILISILKIEEYIKEFNNPEELKYDPKSWDATIRELEIIGEATKHLINHNVFDDSKERLWILEI